MVPPSGVEGSQFLRYVIFIEIIRPQVMRNILSMRRAQVIMLMDKRFEGNLRT